MKRRWWTVGVVAAVAAVGAGTVGAIGASWTPEILGGLKRVVLVRPDAEPAWSQRVVLVDQALAEGNLSRAIYEWREAYHAAIGSRRWDALVAVGDAAVRIDVTGGLATRFRAEARHAYLEALFRARGQGSAEGVLRAANAFERLGDREAAAQAWHTARQIAGRDPRAPGLEARPIAVVGPGE